MPPFVAATSSFGQAVRTSRAAAHTWRVMWLPPRRARLTSSARPPASEARDAVEPLRGREGTAETRGPGRLRARQERAAHRRAAPRRNPLSDALALALQAKHGRVKPCSAITESAGSRSEQSSRTEQLDEPLQGGEALVMGKSAAKAGSARSPRPAPLPGAGGQRELNVPRPG